MNLFRIIATLTRSAARDVAWLGALGLSALALDAARVSPVAARPPAVDPSLPPEVQPLHALVGTWVGKATLTMGATRDDLTVRMKCEAASSGLAIACQTRFAGKQLVSEETDLFGWDPQAKKYHWFAVTSLGDTHDHAADGPIAAGGSLTFVYRGLEGGKPYEERITLALTPDCAHLRFDTIGQVDGKTMLTLAGAADKQ